MNFFETPYVFNERAVSINLEYFETAFLLLKKLEAARA